MISAQVCFETLMACSNNVFIDSTGCSVQAMVQILVNYTCLIIWAISPGSVMAGNWWSKLSSAYCLCEQVTLNVVSQANPWTTEKLEPVIYVSSANELQKYTCHGETKGWWFQIMSSSHLDKLNIQADGIHFKSSKINKIRRKCGVVASCTRLWRPGVQ